MFIIDELLLKGNAAIKKDCLKSWGSFVLVFDVLHCFVEKGISYIYGLIVFKVLSWIANLYARPVGIAFHCPLQRDVGLYIHGLKRNIKLKCHKPSSNHSVQSRWYRDSLFLQFTHLASKVHVHAFIWSLLDAKKLSILWYVAPNRTYKEKKKNLYWFSWKDRK